MKTIDEQMRCVLREIHMRKVVYPKRVADGRMRQEEADHEIACMEAVRDNLQQIKSQPNLL